MKILNLFSKDLHALKVFSKGPWVIKPCSEGPYILERVLKDLKRLYSPGMGLIPYKCSW